MTEQPDIQLHFDVLSCRALLSCRGKDYVLPDTYPSKEAAALGAKRFVRDRLGLRPGAKKTDLTVAQR